MKLLAIIVISLIISPALAQVFVTPGDVVSVLGGSATFFCSTITTSIDQVTSAQWLLNDTLLEDSDIDNVQTLAGTIQLRFSPVSLDYHTTRIRCRGTLLSGNIITSDEVMLLVQGLLSAADSLSITASDSTLSLTWEPPFTLDITNVDPDITGYCVDVVNSTSSVTLHSECNITAPLFSYPIPPDADCHRYNFTVRTVNVVGMGEPATVTLVAVGASPYTLNVVRVTVINPAIFNYMLNMSAPVCSSEVTLLSNLDTGEMLAFNSTDVTVHDNSIITITFNRSQVTDNHHYNVFVVAANSAGENSSRIVISTHDIINFFIATTGTEVTVETEYFEGSNATGALYMFIANDSGAVDFTPSALVVLDRATSDDYELPFSLSAGPYRVFVYNIEENRLLSNEVGYPAVTDEVELARGTKQGFMIAYRQLEDCTSNVSVYLFTVECTYPSNSSATGFQMIVQLGDPDRVHMLYVNQTTDQQSSVTVEVEEGGTFFVSVIPILKDMGITNSSVEYTAILTAKGITTISNTEVTTLIVPEAPGDSTIIPIAGMLVGVVLIIILVTIGILLLCVYTRKRKSMGNQSQIALDSQEDVPDDETLSPHYSTVNKREIANGNHHVGTEPTEKFQDTDEIPPPLPPPCEDAADKGPVGLDKVELELLVEGAVVVDVGDHYAALNLSTQAEGENMMIRDNDLVYATAVGFKNRNSNYAFVDPTSRTASEAVNLHEVSRDLLDGVVYSDIIPQKEPVNKDLKQTPPPTPEKRDFSSMNVHGAASAC